MESSVPIRVSGRAVSYFGSQSISNDTSAVFELIKNSRDADARMVTVTFENLGKDNSKIVVEDNGTGMTLDDIMDKWLVAGTDTKVREPRTTRGRNMLGEKGIGRFACEKLAKRTTMESYPEDDDEMIRMHFDWDRYKDPGTTFDQVRHPLRTSKKADASKHGLRLVLEGLNSDWKESDIRKVTDELGTFILPDELKGQDDIDIVINAEQYGVSGEHVAGTTTKRAPIKMTAVFADDGELSVKISDIDNNQGKPFDCSPEKMHNSRRCGPFRFKLYFYPRDTAKARGGRYESYYDDDITDFLRDHSGVYLYNDGAWMKPLGGKHDWLGLEARRVQRGTRIGLSQVYGVIQISHVKNPDIRSTSHRETVQENPAFDDLKDMIMLSIKQLETYRAGKKQDESTTGPGSDELAENNIDAAIKTAGSLKDKMPADAYNKFKHDLTTTRKFIKKQVHDKKDEITQFGELRHHEDTVVAIGLLTSYMAREIMTPLQDNINVLASIRNTMENTDFEKVIDEGVVKDGWEWIQSLEDNTGRMLHFASFVRELSKHVAASVRRKGRPAQFRVAEAWKTVADGFGDFTRDLEIDVSDDVDEGPTISFSRIDLETVLTNMFLNSIAALKKKDGTRRIRLKATYSHGLTIRFSDNGVGVRQEHLDRIFDPFYAVTDGPDDAAHGHGLGLAIVKKIASRHGGSTTAESPSTEFGSGTAITVSFPGVSRVVTK